MSWLGLLGRRQVVHWVFGMVRCLKWLCINNCDSREDGVSRRTAPIDSSSGCEGGRHHDDVFRGILCIDLSSIPRLQPRGMLSQVMSVVVSMIMVRTCKDISKKACNQQRGRNARAHCKAETKVISDRSNKISSQLTCVLHASMRYSSKNNRSSGIRSISRVHVVGVEDVEVIPAKPHAVRREYVIYRPLDTMA